MSRTLSPSTGKSYGLARVAAAGELLRSTYYARRHRRARPPTVFMERNFRDPTAAAPLKRMMGASLGAIGHT